MKKYTAFIGFIVISFVLCGCTGTNNENNSISFNDKFVGTWEEVDGSENAVYIFSSDGSCSMSILGFLTGNWKLDNDKLVIDIDNDPRIFTYAFSFSDNFLCLTLVDQDSQVESIFEKQIE